MCKAVKRNNGKVIYINMAIGLSSARLKWCLDGPSLLGVSLQNSIYKYLRLSSQINGQQYFNGAVWLSYITIRNQSNDTSISRGREEGGLSIRQSQLYPT